MSPLYECICVAVAVLVTMTKWKQQMPLTTQRLVHPREVSSMKLRKPLRRMTGLLCISATSGTNSVSSVQASVRRADVPACFRLGRLDVEPSDITLRLSLEKHRLGLCTDAIYHSNITIIIIIFIILT